MAKPGLTFEQARRIALALPTVTEGSYYGRPAFFRDGAFFLGYRKDIEALVVKISFDDRDLLMRAKPETFFITDHYLNYPSMLVRLATVRAGEARQVIENSWEGAQPPKRKPRSKPR